MKALETCVESEELLVVGLSDKEQDELFVEVLQEAHFGMLTQQKC